MSAALLILGVIAYLTAGLWVSRNWYRRLPPRYNPFADEEADAAVLVFIWPGTEANERVVVLSRWGQDYDGPGRAREL